MASDALALSIVVHTDGVADGFDGDEDFVGLVGDGSELDAVDCGDDFWSIIKFILCDRSVRFIHYRPGVILLPPKARAVIRVGPAH